MIGDKFGIFESNAKKNFKLYDMYKPFFHSQGGGFQDTKNRPKEKRKIKGSIQVPPNM